MENLPQTITESKLAEIFTGCNIIGAKVVRPTMGGLHDRAARIYGLVEFATKEDQIRALGERSGFLLPTINGESMAIDISIKEPLPNKF